MGKPKFKVGDRSVFTNRTGSGAHNGEECTVIQLVPPEATGNTCCYNICFDDGFSMSVREEELAHRAH